MTIQHSDQLDQFFMALSQLQGRLENATKDTCGVDTKHKYAKLTQYLELSKELLEEYGFCIMQPPGTIEIVEVTRELYNKSDQSYFFQNILVPKQKITTFMGHKSGQYMSETMEILVEKTLRDSWGQSSGKAITYGRRYALSGTLGMGADDDDNQLTQRDMEKSHSPSKNYNAQNYQKIIPSQCEEIKKALEGEPERILSILKWANVSSLENLSTAHYDKIVETLTKEGKMGSSVSNSNSSLIGPEQAQFITRLVTPERLNKILKDYNLTKLEEMSLKDYYKEYDILRQETNILTAEKNIKESV